MPPVPLKLFEYGTVAADSACALAPTNNNATARGAVYVFMVG